MQQNANLRRVKSAAPIYIAAAIWVVYGMIFPLYSLPYIVFAVVLSIVAYMVAGKFFPGKMVEVEPALDAGDQEINRQLKESRESLKKLRAANEAIPSPEISRDLDRMERAGMKILSAVAEKPSRAGQVRRFMNYYLPTAAKLLDQYSNLTAVGATGENVERATKSVENSLDMIASAFEKQLDNLYRDEAVDITTDIDVLETMMAQDGLTKDKGMNNPVKKDTESNILKGDH